MMLRRDRSLAPRNRNSSRSRRGVAAKGYRCQIDDEYFGRSLRLKDPDGVELQIQEIEYDKAKQSVTGDA